jgi:hypothetical protein
MFVITSFRVYFGNKDFKFEWKHALEEVKFEFDNVLGIEFLWKEYGCDIDGYKYSGTEVSWNVLCRCIRNQCG